MAAKRKTMYGFNTFIAIVLFIGILSIVNYLSERHNIRADLTESDFFSLADQTVKVLKGLEDDVWVYAFFKDPDTSGEEMRLRDLFEEYDVRSEKFHYEFIDPDKKPERAKAYDVKQYRTVVIVSGDKEEQILDVNEEKLTNAILKVSREERKKVFFLEGHGERDIENIDREGYNTAKIALEEENYDIAKIMLAREETIPDDCAALIVASPKVDLLANELEKIEGYLKSGGSVLLMLDPSPGIGMESFLSKWGVEVGDDVVVDVSGMGRLFGAGPTIPLVSEYLSHSITEDFNVMTFFPLARSVTPVKREETSAQTLLRTTARSWAERNYQEEPFKPDEDVDLMGPISLAVAVTREIETEADSLAMEELPDGDKAASRMVVFGDADFACNSYFTGQGNSDLFLNVVNWLAEEEDLISIRPKVRADRRVTMTSTQTKYVFYLTVFAMPLLVLVAGIVVKVRRR